MSSKLAGIRADQPRSYFAIEKQANSVRSALGYGELEPFDAPYFFDHQLGSMVVEFEGEEIALQESLELCDSEGLTHWDSDARKIYVGLSEETYGLLLAGHVRAKYTVAH